MMDKEHGANCADHIEFIIALMTKDYTKVCSIGDQLLKRNRNETNVISILNILKHKNQLEAECSNNKRRLSSIDNPIKTDNQYEANNVADGDETIDINMDIQINPKATSKVVSHGTSQFNDDKNRISFDREQKMLRVIPIRLDQNLEK